jgi:hypothetical protein
LTQVITEVSQNINETFDVSKNKQINKKTFIKSIENLFSLILNKLVNIWNMNKVLFKKKDQNSNETFLSIFFNTTTNSLFKDKDNNLMEIMFTSIINLYNKKFSESIKNSTFKSMLTEEYLGFLTSNIQFVSSLKGYIEMSDTETITENMGQLEESYIQIIKSNLQEKLNSIFKPIKDVYKLISFQDVKNYYLYIISELNNLKINEKIMVKVTEGIFSL